MKTKRVILAALTMVCAMTTMLTSCAIDNNDNPVTPLPSDTSDDLTAYTVRQLPVNRDGEADGTVAIRFYEDMPSVPYISVADFQSLMLPGTTATVTKTGTGLYLIENPGGTATVNTVEETCDFDDYMAFTNLMGFVQRGMDNAYYDGAPFVRYSHQTLSGGSPAVSFDYSRYGINLRGDDRAVYFPFTTLADLYADLYYHNAACNGEKVVVAARDDQDMGIGTIDNDFSTEKLLAKGERPADLAAYSYAELCFVIDHFYGKPGRAPYEASISRDGLDQTLASSANGQAVRRLLLSGDMQDYAYGLNMLNAFLYDRGHTGLWDADVTIISADDTSFATQYPSLYEQYMNDYFYYRIELAMQMYGVMQPQRNAIYGDEEPYHKKGNTAICHFDAFSSTDDAAWKNFYNGTAPRPTLETSPKDPMTIFLYAVEKAAADPEVENLVIDLTQNRGGSLDVVVAMTSLMYDQSFARCENVLTGQHTLWYYDVDRNFDGKFDAKDKEVHYDLNFSVLTTHMAFSCGNLFPALCKEAGLLIMGEKSGGGSCAISYYRTADGFLYHISSARGRLADENWQNIDGGITPHVQIEYGQQYPLEYLGKTFYQYGLEHFYDLDNLSSIVNGYYHP